MRRRVRVAAVLVGLAIGVYGMASLTGGWLGFLPHGRQFIVSEDGTEQIDHKAVWREVDEVFFGQVWIALGVFVAASGAWPRRVRNLPSTI